MDTANLYNLFHDTIAEYKHDNWLKVKTTTMAPSFRGYFTMTHVVSLDELSQIHEPKIVMSQCLQRVYKSVLEHVYDKLNPVRHVGMKIDSNARLPQTVNTFFLTDFNMRHMLSLINQSNMLQQDQKSHNIILIDKASVKTDGSPIYALDINDLHLKLNIGANISIEDNWARIKLEWSVYITNPNVTHLSIYQNQ